jgi:NAD(P)-dependent dehydrogenase (short-subunit alcohol dehydrogenase family)
LEEKLAQTKGARLVSVASSAEAVAPAEGFVFSQWKSDQNYDDATAYGQSKLANILFAQGAAKRWGGKDVAVYSCHPGIIMTDLGQTMADTMVEDMKSLDIRRMVVPLVMTVLGPGFVMAQFAVEDGALTQLHLATATDINAPNGAFFTPIGTLAQPSHSAATNPSLADELWMRSLEAVQGH